MSKLLNHIGAGCVEKETSSKAGRRNMQLFSITVDFYLSEDGDEMLQGFHWQERYVEVGEVLDRWYQVESKPEWPRANYFKVRSADNHEYLLKHDLESGEWYLGKQW